MNELIKKKKPAALCWQSKKQRAKFIYKVTFYK